VRRPAITRQQRTAPFGQLDLSNAIRQSVSALAVVVAVNVALLALLLYLERVHGIDHWDLVRDTNAIAGQPTYFGAYSNLGVLVWAVAASVAIFTWVLLRKRTPGDARLRVLGLGGLFASTAGLDDLFMLHETSYVVGVSDKTVMAAYALFLLAFVASAVPVLQRTKWLLLLGLLGSFATSFLFDTTHFPGSVLVEEVCKLTGISFLAAYLLTLSWSVISDAVQRGAPVRQFLDPRA
jgi:hypothetical protein